MMVMTSHKKSIDPIKIKLKFSAKSTYLDVPWYSQTSLLSNWEFHNGLYDKSISLSISYC